MRECDGSSVVARTQLSHMGYIHTFHNQLSSSFFESHRMRINYPSLFFPETSHPRPARRDWTIRLLLFSPPSKCMIPAPFYVPPSLDMLPPWRNEWEKTHEIPRWMIEFRMRWLHVHETEVAKYFIGYRIDMKRTWGDYTSRPPWIRPDWKQVSSSFQQDDDIEPVRECVTSGPS